MKKITKKEVKSIYEAGKCANLMKHIITDGSKKDTIDALYLLFKTGSGSYERTFESVPYSRGGKYARHTSTLHTTQSWGVEELGASGYCILTHSTSNSRNCPPVVVPTFYTEVGKAYYNAKIQGKINELEAKKIK